MTRLVIEHGPLAASLVASVRGGKPAVAASVRAFIQCDTERRDLELPRGIRQTWQSAGDQGHQSPSAGMFYSAPAKPSAKIALG